MVTSLGYPGFSGLSLHKNTSFCVALIVYTGKFIAKRDNATLNSIYNVSLYQYCIEESFKSIRVVLRFII